MNDFIRTNRKKKYYRASVICFIIILSGCSMSNFSKSADFNGDFEIINGKINLPYNWNFGPSKEIDKGTIKFSLDMSDKVSGNQSLKIENLSPVSAGLRSYQYPVDSGATYKVIISLKNPDSILKFDLVAWSKDGLTPRNIEMIIDESFDHWIEVENQVTIQENESKLMVHILLEDNGTAWLDNARIVKMN